MQRESLVECINNKGCENIVKLNTPYTARHILKKGDTLYKSMFTHIIVYEDAIFLEEASLPDIVLINGEKFEPPFPLRNFRELFPPDINIEELINDDVLKPELV